MSESEKFTEVSGDVVDHLKIVLTRGDGKTVYDSEKDPTKVKSKMVIPEKPKTFCLDCGGKLQAVIFRCKDCHNRFLQTQEMVPFYDEVEKKMKFKPGRLLVVALPNNEDVEKTDPEKVAEDTQAVQSQDP